jgi:CheY-like chemotaxis protein
MSDDDRRGKTPDVVVLADVASTAKELIDRTLDPAGIHAWTSDDSSVQPDVLVVDVTQLRGDPLGELRTRRSQGDEAPAIVLAAHFPTAHIRDLFRLGVADVLLKPYKGVDLCRAVYELSEARSSEVTTQLLARRLQTTREQARRRSEEIRWLSEIGRTVVNLRDLDEILTRVVEAAAFLTDAEEANIYLVEADTQEVVLRASKSAGESRGTMKRLRITDTLAGQVYRSGKPVVRQPAQEGPAVKVQTGFIVQSLIKVPIRSGDQVVGVLGVYNRIAPRTFSDHHVTLLGALADWAGVALEQTTARPAADHPTPPPATVTPLPPSSSSSGVVQVAPNVISSLDSLRRQLIQWMESADTAIDVRRRIGLLIKDIDDIQRLPMAVLDPKASATFIDLEAVASRVVEELALAARQRNLDLVFVANGTFPRLRGDRNRAHRVIEALAAAAIRRTRRGRIALSIHVFEVVSGHSDSFPLPADPELEDGMWVAVRVSDSSGGLSPDTVRALSEPQPDPQAGRLGPGLSMGEVRMIAESMGGTLWHNHTPASTSITFALPAK